MTTKTMYHGSDSKTIKVFVPANRGDETNLVWFSPSKKYAAEYGPFVHRVTVEFNRLFDTRTDSEARRIFDEYAEEFGAICDTTKYGEGYTEENLPHWQNNDAVYALAIKHGYDAILTSEGTGKLGLGVPANQIPSHRA